MNDLTAAHTDLLKRPIPGFSIPELKLLQQLLELEKYDYTADESFLLPKAQKSIFDASEDLPEIDASWYRPLLDSLTAHAREENTGKHLVLTAAQEKVIFLRFNYCRFRVAELLGTLNGRRPTKVNTPLWTLMTPSKVWVAPMHLLLRVLRTTPP